MAGALTTNFNYIYDGILTTEIYFKPVLDVLALSDLAIIDPGISFKKQYNVVGTLNKILKPYAGCDRTFTDGVPISNVTLETEEFEVNMRFCKDDFTNQLSGQYNILAQEWLRTGVRSFDIGGTPVASVINQMIEYALRRDVARRIFFGDVDSGSADWNTINGMITRLIDSSGTASTYCVRRAYTPLGTGTLAAGAGLAILQAMYDSASNLLKAQPGKYFAVTGSIYDSYVKSLQGVGNVTEAAFTNLQNGMKVVTFNGIPVIPVRVWDEELADSTNPLYSTTRHFGMLTIKENHIIGVENGPDLNKIEGWYDRETRRYKFEGDMKFGYQYLHCDLAIIVY